MVGPNVSRRDTAFGHRKAEENRNFVGLNDNKAKIYKIMLNLYSGVIVTSH